MTEGPLPRRALVGTARIGGDLPQRVASAAALVPLAIGAAFVGGPLFAAFWLLAGLGVLWEWNALAATAGSTPTAHRVTLVGAAALVLATTMLLLGWARWAASVLIVGALLAGALALPERRLWAAGGVPYAATVALGPVVLRADAPLGFSAIMILFAVVWATDIAAYFGGRLIGGPRLWPRISPKKTWSGALVGTAVGIAAGVAVALWSGLPDLGAVALLLLLLSILSQAGDLWESALKRRFGAKDSGTLIPGHGGLMDRLDGFAAATLLAVAIGLARGGPEAASRGLLIW